MSKEKPDEKNMHSGHRMRVLNSYTQIELDALSPHQVMEYILFYVFPRGDVNPLAHRLLNKYGTVQNVLEANPSELVKTFGINERSAQMLTGFTKIFNYYTSSKLAKKFLLNDSNDVYDLCEDLLRFYSTEVLLAISVDASFHVTAKRQLGKGGVNVVGLDTHEIVNFVNETKPANIIFAHNHPGGYCKPTENDILGNDIIRKLVELMNVQFIDHIIVGFDGVYSILNNKQVRKFSDSEEMKEFAEEFKED